MSGPQDIAIVIGVGPDQGLGAQLCRRFAGHGLHVVPVGRTAAKVEAVAASITESGGASTAMTADITQEADLCRVFAEAGGLGRISLVI